MNPYCLAKVSEVMNVAVKGGYFFNGKCTFAFYSSQVRDSCLSDSGLHFFGYFCKEWCPWCEGNELDLMIESSLFPGCLASNAKSCMRGTNSKYVKNYTLRHQSSKLFRSPIEEVFKRHELAASNVARQGPSVNLHIYVRASLSGDSMASEKQLDGTDMLGFSVLRTLKIVDLNPEGILFRTKRLRGAPTCGEIILLQAPNSAYLSEEPTLATIAHVYRFRVHSLFHRGGTRNALREPNRLVSTFDLLLASNEHPDGGTS